MNHDLDIYKLKTKIRIVNALKNPSKPAVFNKIWILIYFKCKKYINLHCIEKCVQILSTFLSHEL